jgi:type II secretory pathway component GspD/PulD (secretin)
MAVALAWAGAARAQQPSAAAAAPASPAAEGVVNLDLQDAPIRDALTQLFHDSHVDYSIANDVGGFVTMKVTAQPLESALRLMMRAVGDLTYDRVNGVYFVRRRAIDTQPAIAAAAPAPLPEPQVAEQGWDTIQLNYIDPYDLRQILRILIVPTFSRQSGGANRSGGATTTPATVPANAAAVPPGGPAASGAGVVGPSSPVILSN